MQLLLDEGFEAGYLPEGWFSDSPHYRFTPDGLHTGPATGFVVNLPGHGWDALRVEIDLIGDGGSWAYCAWDGVLGLSLTLKDTPCPRHEASEYHTVYAQSTMPLLPRGDGRRLVFDFNLEQMQTAVDGQPILSAPNRRGQVLAGGVHLAFQGGCLIRGIRVFGDGEHATPPYPATPKQNNEYFLEAAVDFTDDLICAPYSAAMYDAYFAELAAWGTRRVHWIFNGRREEGQLDNWPLGADVHAAETMDQVGELFEAACRSAHRHGLQIFAIFKPFDMGFALSYGEGTPEAKARGRLPRIGGPIGWITHFAAAHRELLMARRPGAFGEPENQVFQRIDLVKEDDGPAAISPQDVLLLVSDDNVTYRPYAGPIRRLETVEDYPLYAHTPSGPRPTAAMRRCRVIRLEGLQLTEKYTALVVRGNEKSFANRLLDLLHVYGEKDEEHRLTYAAQIRSGDYHYAYGKRNPFDGTGLEFDHYPGSPTAGSGGGFDGIRANFVLDGGNGPAGAAPVGVDGPYTVLAFARGRERTTVAALSPSFPETRQWWLSWVTDALDMGADGVEFRMANHHADFAYGELGFEPPVRDAFLERYGVDIWATDEFDHAALRRLRGEAYTQFYREAHRLIKSRGKLMGLHIGPNKDTEPEIGGAMDIHWDWRTWLTEGLADSVTLKTCWPGSRLFQEILSFTRPRSIPVIFSPYCNNYFSSYGAAVRKTGGERPVDDLIAWGRQAGCDGFQFYEVACAIEADHEGEVKMVEPALREVFVKHFAR